MTIVKEIVGLSGLVITGLYTRHPRGRGFQASKFIIKGEKDQWKYISRWFFSEISKK